MPDPAAFASPESVLAHESFIRSLARGLVRCAAEAEDLAQHARVQVWAATPAAGRRPGFLRRVLHNRAVDAARERAVRARHERAAARTEAVPSTAEIAERLELRHVLAQAVLTLDAVSQTTVWLRFYEDLPPRAIARTMSVPVATVRTRLRRALIELRGRLRTRFGEEQLGVALVELAGAAASAPRWPPVLARPLTWMLAGGAGLAVLATLVLVPAARGPAAAWDFAIGDWDVTGRALVAPREGRWQEEPPAPSHIERAADGGLRETWRYRDERHVLLRRFDEAEQVWRVRWLADGVARVGVDHYVGSFAGDRSVLDARYAVARAPGHRLVFRRDGDDHFVMEFATSPDAGRSWVVRYVRDYRRRR